MSTQPTDKPDPKDQRNLDSVWRLTEPHLDGAHVLQNYRTLRSANIARQAAWRAEQSPDLSFRGNELAGETGEVCNVIKKIERQRQGWRGSQDTKEHLAEELADVVICADLIGIAAGIDLESAVASKFNATSEKVGLPHRLAPSVGADGKPANASGASSPTLSRQTEQEDTARSYREEEPLRCEIVDGCLSISVGVNTLRDGLQVGWKYFGDENEVFTITNAAGFTEDIVRALTREDEQGSSLLSDLLDESASKAINNGSEWVDRKEVKE